MTGGTGVRSEWGPIGMGESVLLHTAAAVVPALSVMLRNTYGYVISVGSSYVIDSSIGQLS